MAAQASSNSHLRIFISYGHDEHAGLAQKLKEDLVTKGHEVWFDLDRIKPGTDWERYIEDGLNWVSQDANGRVILIMTPYSVRRPDGYCLNELARAAMKNLKILPIMLVWCEPPLSICRIQWLDMQDCLPLGDRRERYEARFEQLVEALQHDRVDFEGYQSQLSSILKPLSFDAEIKYNLDRFTGRAWVFDEYSKWLANCNSSRVFWIVGGPGVGKTAISAWLCAHSPEIVALHFCRYDNVEKRDPRRAVMSIAYQLSTQLPDYEERLRRVSMDGVQGLDARTLFDKLIVQPFNANYPDPGRKVVVLIDALDEAVVDEKNELANLIANMFDRTPTWLRLIITSRPNPEVMAPLQSYQPFTIDISDPRNIDDIKAYLYRELGRTSDKVRPEEVEAIAGKSGGLFLYAEWIASEISKGHLSLDRPEEFPHNLGGIYLKLFERQIPDMGEWDSTIAPALDVIAAAQEPLSLDMLASIFQWNVRDRRKFQRDVGALFTFDHGIQPFHKSVLDWLLDETKHDPYCIDLAEGNKLLTEYLWQKYKNDVKSDLWSQYLINHLPQHLFKVQRWKDLKALLLDMKFIAIAAKTDKWRLLSQLVAIDERSPIKLNLIYGKDLPLEGNDEKGLMAIAELLAFCSLLDESERITDYLVPHISQSQALGMKFLNSFMRTRMPEAISISFEWASRKTNNKRLMAEALSGKSQVLSYNYRFEEALRAAEECEEISREIDYKPGIAASLNVRGLAKMYTLDVDDCIRLLNEGERLARELGLIDLLAQSLNFQGFIYRRKGDPQTALAKLEESASICRQIRYYTILCVVLMNQGFAYYAMGRLDEAMSTFEETERLSKEWNKSVLCLGVLGRGYVLYTRNRVDEAVALFKKAAECALASGEQIGIQFTLGTLAFGLAGTGDKTGAREALERRAKICKERGFSFDYQQTMEMLRALEAGKELKFPT